MSITPIKALTKADLTRPNWQTIPPRDYEHIWLDKNENLDHKYLEWIKKDVISAINEIDFSTYPDLGELYKKLSGQLGVQSAQILLSAGSDGAIRTVFHSFVSPSDRVFITNPSFAMYDVY